MTLVIRKLSCLAAPVVFAVLGLPAFGQAAKTAAPAASGTTGQPTRQGFFAIEPSLDATKGLAAADYAGWAAAGDVIVGSATPGWVEGYSLANRKPVWWLAAPSSLTAPPTPLGSWVVLGFRNGKLLKVESQTGKTVWEANLDSFPQRTFALAGNTLLAVSAAQMLYGIDYQTGKTQWIYDGGYPEGLSINAGPTPVVQANTVFLGLASGEIAAVDLSTGKLLWRQSPAPSDARFHDIIGELVADNQRLLFSRYDGLIGAIDLGSSAHKLAWQDQLPSVTTSSYRQGHYYVGTLSGDVYAYDAASGTRQWRVITGQPVATVTAGERALFVAGTQGRVTTIDAQSGAVLWTDDLEGSLYARPLLFDDVIYFETGLRNLYSYRIH